MQKACVTHNKYTTIMRRELVTVVLYFKISKLLQKELLDKKETFLTDSEAVAGWYTRN